MKRLISMFVLGAALQGCAYLTPPLEQPVIEEKLNPTFGTPGLVGTLSLTPERRVVLVNFDTKRFCAEAPTEVGIDLSALRKFSADLAKTDKASIGAELIAAVAAQNNVLNRRSQGMMLLLANGYYGCQMYMNGAITKEELLKLMRASMDDAREVIKEEIKYLYKDPAAQKVAESAGVNPVREEVGKLTKEELERIRKCEADNPGIKCSKKDAQAGADKTGGSDTGNAGAAGK